MICKIAELLKVGMYREDTEDTFCSVLRMNHSDSQLRSEEYIIVTLKWLRLGSNIVRQGLHGWRGEPNFTPVFANLILFLNHGGTLTLRRP